MSVKDIAYIGIRDVDVAERYWKAQHMFERCSQHLCDVILFILQIYNRQVRNHRIHNARYRPTRHRLRHGERSGACKPWVSLRWMF